MKRYENYDYQGLLAQSVTTIEDGDSKRFPQGAVVDRENSKFYISRQTTGNYDDQMIFQYDLNNQELIKSVPVPMEKRVYLEGLVYFFNTSEELCFIVPISKYGKFGIFNFDTEEVEKEFSMPGNYKIGIDNNRKYFLAGRNKTGLDPNSSMDGVFLYDLQSVINGSPVLIHEVEFLHEQMFAHKIQGLTMIEDEILLGQGSNQQVLSVIDLGGNLLHMVSWDSKEIIELVNGNPDSSNQLVESEGVSWMLEDGKTIPILFNCTQGKASIIKVGEEINGARLKHQLYKGVNPIKAISNSSVFNLVQNNGQASIRVGKGEDFYQAVEELEGMGLYTFYSNGAAKNNPFGGRSVRGTIFVDRLTNNGVTSLAEIRCQDYRGTVWANYYDVLSSSTWMGWSHIGGPVVDAPSNFDPFNSNPGVYETTSSTNAPVDGNGVKIYTITESSYRRKQIKCNYSSAGSIYYANFHTDGVFRGWKKVSLVNT